MTHDDDQRQKREAALRVLRVTAPSTKTDAHGSTADGQHVPTPAELSSAVAQFDGDSPRTVAVSSLSTLRGAPARHTGGFSIRRPEDAPAAQNVQPFAPRKGE